MCQAIQEMRANERTEGEAKGILNTLISLFRKGIVTLAQAAEEAKMSPEEFQAKAAEQRCPPSNKTEGFLRSKVKSGCSFSKSQDPKKAVAAFVCCLVDRTSMFQPAACAAKTLPLADVFLGHCCCPMAVFPRKYH